MDIRDSLNRLSSEISVEDTQKNKILQLLNEMFSLFEIVYSKNVGLINICQIMNDDVVQSANQIAKNLSDSDQSQNELKKLNENYQNIITVATERRDSLIETKIQVQEYKDRISFLKKTLCSTRATPESNRKLINDLKNEIKTLKVECQKNLQKSQDLTRKLQENSDNLEYLKNTIISYNTETETTLTLIDDLEKEKVELHQMNIETKKEINELESENTKIEEKQLEEKEKLDLQRDKLNLNDFTKMMNEFQNKILILQEEKDDKLQSISKMLKQLKKIKAENSNKINNRTKILIEIQKRDEQLDSVKQTIKSLNREYKEHSPQYYELVKKYSTLQNDKKELRDKYKKLQENRFRLNCVFSKNENEKQAKIRKVQQEIIDNTNQNKYVQRESQKTDEISRQALDVNNDMTNIKRGLFEDGRYAKTINDEIEESQNQQKFYLKNYFHEKSIIDNNVKLTEELKEQIIEKRKKGDEHIQNMEIAKQEKENYTQKMKQVQKEHDHLSSQYHEITSQVENLTKKIDTLINDTIQEHFLASEYKTAMSYINKMKKKSLEGIKTTKKVTLNLIGEQKTLKKIIDQTRLDELSQKKHIQVLKASQDRIIGQIAEKVKEIESKNSEVISLNLLLKKGHDDYDKMLDHVSRLGSEYTDVLRKSNLLQSNVAKLNELRENKKILEENLIVAKRQTAALFNESQIRVHIHRWHELEGIDRQAFINLKFHQRLKAKLIEKTEELKKLEIQRDELFEKVNDRRKYVERFFHQKAPFIIESEEEEIVDDSGDEVDETNVFLTYTKQAKFDFLREQIERMKYLLKEKSSQLSEMKRTIENQSHLIIENRESVASLRRMINERKSATFQIKSDISEMKSRIRNSIDQINNEQTDSNKQTPQKVDDRKMKTNITVLGGGFRPNPPQNNINKASINSARRIRRNNRFYNDREDEYDENNNDDRNNRKIQSRPFRRSIQKNNEDEKETDFVVKKRNGRRIKMKKLNENQNDDEKRFNYDALKEGVNFNYVFDRDRNYCNSNDDVNFRPHPPPSCTYLMRRKMSENKKKASRNVAVPETSSRAQEKKKKKVFKKKK